MMKSLGQVCGETGNLSKLLDYGHYLARIEAALNAWLPPPLAGHITLANLRRGELVLQADSPAWASRLRFLTPQLLEFCRRHPQMAGKVENIRIKVAAPATPPPPTRAKPVLSGQAAESIQAIAGQVADQALRDALLRLAERGMRRKG